MKKTSIALLLGIAAIGCSESAPPAKPTPPASTNMSHTPGLKTEHAPADAKKDDAAAPEGKTDEKAPEGEKAPESK